MTTDDSTVSLDLTCRELVEIVTDYLEDALPANERAWFEEHLLVCGGCADYVAQMRETIRIAGHLRDEDVPVAGRERLLAAFRGWKRTGT